MSARRHPSATGPRHGRTTGQYGAALRPRMRPRARAATIGATRVRPPRHEPAGRLEAAR